MICLRGISIYVPLSVSEALLKNKNVDLLKLILKEYARNISTEAKKSSMIRDILSSGEREKLDEDTFDKYVKILKDLFIIYDMPA